MPAGFSWLGIFGVTGRVKSLNGFAMTQTYTFATYFYWFRSSQRKQVAV